MKQYGQRIAKLERDRATFATRRLVAALLDDGRVIEMQVDGLGLSSVADGMSPESKWVATGAARIDAGKLTIVPTALRAADDESS